MSKYNKITQEKLKNLCNEIFNRATKGRQFTLRAYCRGNDGFREYGTEMKGLCDHPNCTQCRNFQKICKDEVNTILEKYKDEK